MVFFTMIELLIYYKNIYLYNILNILVFQVYYQEVVKYFPVKLACKIVRKIAFIFVLFYN